jgi:hypothetical protein
MKRSIRLALLVIGSLIASQAGAALAQDNSTPTQPQNPGTIATTIVSGTIVSTNDGSLAIKSDGGAQLTFSLDGATTHPGQMSPGDRIDVQYELVAGGPLHALRVTAESGGATAAADGTAGADQSNGDGTGHDGSMKKMPHTASWIPLLALTGAVSLGASLALRVARRVRT